jgi:hypothetical protein
MTGTEAMAAGNVWYADYGVRWPIPLKAVGLDPFWPKTVRCLRPDGDVFWVHEGKLYADEADALRLTLQAVESDETVARERLAIAQDAKRRLQAALAGCRAADIAAADAALAIPVTVVDDDEADIDPDSTDLYEPDQGEPVASASGWPSDGPAACCWKCLAGQPYMRMLLCPACGNKRCPKASDHELACTGSNEPGQPGSVFGPPVASHLEPAGADVKGPAYHGQQS